MIALQFHAGRTLSTRIVQLATWSWTSHVDVELPDGNLIGAVPGEGVVIRDSATINAKRIERFFVDTTKQQNRAIYKAIESQLGAPYDWGGVLGIGFHRNWQAYDSWFCSELVTWAFAGAGVSLLRTDRAWRITPRDLLLSPLLKNEKSNG